LLHRRNLDYKISLNEMYQKFKCIESDFFSKTYLIEIESISIHYEKEAHNI
jgi:hypothetical protein